MQWEALNIHPLRVQLGPTQPNIWADLGGYFLYSLRLSFYNLNFIWVDLGQSFDNPSITLNPNLILIKKFSIVDEINPTQLPFIYLKRDIVIITILLCNFSFSSYKSMILKSFILNKLNLIWILTWFSFECWFNLNFCLTYVTPHAWFEFWLDLKLGMTWILMQFEFLHNLITDQISIW